MNNAARDNGQPPSGLALLAGGAAAGLVAAFVTSLFQTAWSASPLGTAATEPGDSPPTEVLADRVCHALTGDHLDGLGKAVGGVAVHYATGAALGIAYVLLVRRWPRAATARGTAYGITVWATVEETGLALLGLKPPPWRVKPGEHAFAAASHVVFGLAVDAMLVAARKKNER